MINSAGIIGLTFLILLFFTVSDESDWIYNGGFYLISTMTLLIIASVVHPTTILAKLLEILYLSTLESVHTVYTYGIFL